MEKRIEYGQYEVLSTELTVLGPIYERENEEKSLMLEVQFNAYVRIGEIVYTCWEIFTTPLDVEEKD